MPDYRLRGRLWVSQSQKSGETRAGLVPNGAQKKPAQGSAADRDLVRMGGSEGVKDTASVLFHGKRQKPLRTRT